MIRLISLISLWLLTFSISVGFSSQNPLPIVPEQVIHSASCRIVIHNAKGIDLGSGTLIARNEHSGDIISCNHLFADGVTSIEIFFPNGEHFSQCRIVATDKHDLSIIQVVPRPQTNPVPMADEAPTGEVKLCGYGGRPTYGFRAFPGRVLNYGETLGEGFSPHALIAGDVRFGDSGGGCFDSQGRLCGVIWGGSDVSCYGVPNDPNAAIARVAAGQPILTILKAINVDKPSSMVSLAGCCNGFCSSGACSGGQCQSGCPNGQCSGGSCSNGQAYSSQGQVRVYENQSQSSSSSAYSEASNALKIVYDNEKKLSDKLSALESRLNTTSNLIGASGCQCGDKWKSLEERLAAIKSCNCSGMEAELTTLKNEVASLKNELTLSQQAPPIVEKPQAVQPSELQLEGIVRKVPK